MKVVPLASVSLLLIVMACHPVPSQTSEDGVTTRAKNLLGKEALVIKNEQNSFALCTLQKTNSIEYLVIRIADVATVEKGNTNGSVTWSGEMEIKVSSVPGMIKKFSDSEDFIKIIDLRKYVLTSH